MSMVPTDGQRLSLGEVMKTLRDDWMLLLDFMHRRDIKILYLTEVKENTKPFKLIFHFI